MVGGGDVSVAGTFGVVACGALRAMRLVCLSGYVVGVM